MRRRPKKTLGVSTQIHKKGLGFFRFRGMIFLVFFRPGILAQLKDEVMALLAPPPLPPPVSVADDDRLSRLHFRLWQITASAITVMVTGWFCTFGPLSALIALTVAKHVLVAVLLMGMDLHGVEK
jgi:hypothetical protein